MKAAAEDREFCRRWIQAGGMLVWHPQATIRHCHSLSLKRFVVQHISYGRGAYHDHQRHLPRAHGLPPLESIGFYVQLLTDPRRSQVWRSHGNHPRWCIASCLVLSQLAALVGYVQERFGPGFSLHVRAPVRIR